MKVRPAKDYLLVETFKEETKKGSFHASAATKSYIKAVVRWNPTQDSPKMGYIVFFKPQDGFLFEEEGPNIYLVRIDDILAYSEKDA